MKKKNYSKPVGGIDATTKSYDRFRLNQKQLNQNGTNMKLRLFSLVMLIMTAINLSAHDFSYDGLWYNIIDETNKYVEVTYKSDNFYSNSSYVSGNITIPNAIIYKDNTYTVTSIGNYAFRNCRELTCVNIPNSVTNIGKEAFYYCFELTKIVIPNSVTNIEDKAFYRCKKLTDINIPNSVTSIGEYTFYECLELTNINLGNSVTSIGLMVFDGCSSLTSIDIPNSVTSIDDSAFSGCSGLTSIIVEDGNTKYDSRDNCNAIIESDTNTLIVGCINTIIPNSVTSIGGWAFYGRSSLTSIDIPNSVTSIGRGAFSGCSSLTNINIPDNVTSIESYTFNKCFSLTNINIPNGVTSIGEKAFYSCNLTSIELPNNVTNIGLMAFSDCYNLCEITCLAENVPMLDYSVFTGSPSSTGTLYVPESAVDAYKAADQWKDWGNIVGIKNKDYTPGDVNGDGDIDVVDVTSTISCALGDEPENFNREAADVNEDGEIDVVDVTAIISMAM